MKISNKRLAELEALAKRAKTHPSSCSKPTCKCRTWCDREPTNQEAFEVAFTESAIPLITELRRLRG